MPSSSVIVWVAVVLAELDGLTWVGNAEHDGIPDGLHVIGAGR